MSRWLGLLSLGLAECPGELSRVSQVPFSSASFWQGLHFAVQNHLGESLHQCTYSLCPAGRGPALSLVLGVAGCNSRAGLCSIPALTGRATMSSVLRRAARGCASPRMSAPRTHAIACHPVPSPIPFTLLTVILRVLPWRPGCVRQGPFSHTSFWRGLYFPVQFRLGLVSHAGLL